MGGPIVPLAYCIAIHPDLVWADAELRKVGGCVKAQMDDINLLGPLRDVFRVTVELAERLKQRCNQHLNASKCKIVGRDTDGIHAFLASNTAYSEFQVACAPGSNPLTVQWGERVGPTVNGTPVGDAKFIDSHIAKVCEAAEAKIDKITHQLRDSNTQALGAIGAYCLQPLIRHLLQSLPPSIIMGHAKKFDKAINKLQLHVTGVDLDASNHITAGRARLPRRMFGTGFTSQSNTALAAWMGCQLLTLPRKLDVLEKDGTTTGGFMPSLTSLLGAGSFDHDKHETRFLHLCTEESTCPLGIRFMHAWHTLQIGVSGSPNIPPPQYGILSRHVFATGTIDKNTTYDHFQKEITTEREIRAQALPTGSRPPQNCAKERGQVCHAVRQLYPLRERGDQQP